MDDDEDIGGESVCYAHYFCDQCGVLLDGREHLATCELVVADLKKVPTQGVE